MISLQVTSRCVSKLISLSPGAGDSAVRSYKVGILLGTSDTKSITVQDALLTKSPIDSEEIFAPGSWLDHFLRGFQEASQELELSWLELVGWFAFHNQDCEISPAEMQFHDRHFARKSALTLIATPTADRSLSVKALTGLDKAAIPGGTHLFATGSIDLLDQRKPPLKLVLRAPLTDELLGPASDSVTALARTQRWQQRKEKWVAAPSTITPDKKKKSIHANAWLAACVCALMLVAAGVCSYLYFGLPNAPFFSATPSNHVRTDLLGLEFRSLYNFLAHGIEN